MYQKWCRVLLYDMELGDLRKLIDDHAGLARDSFQRTRQWTLARALRRRRHRLAQLARPRRRRAS